MNSEPLFQNYWTFLLCFLLFTFFEKYFNTTLIILLLNSIKKFELEPILNDERGLFFEVLNKTEITHIIVTTFTKDAVRGNQFRKNMDQYFF